MVSFIYLISGNTTQMKKIEIFLEKNDSTKNVTSLPLSLSFIIYEIAESFKKRILYMSRREYPLNKVMLIKKQSSLQNFVECFNRF